SIENLKRNYIINYLNEIQLIDNIEYKNPFAGSSYYIINGNNKIMPGQIKFLKNGDKFYANRNEYSSLGKSSFIERDVKGKINIFESTSVSIDYGNSTSGGLISGFRFSTWTDYYYNFGFDNLKKANYINLTKDLIDNSISLDILDKYKSRNTSSI